jgi:cytoskeleton protein RodZ
MSDDKLDTTEIDASASQEVTPAAMPISAGQLMRDARNASGMHIATLSMALKVPVRKLEALEADDWTQLPDAVFVRALATSVCRHIKTDSAPILAALPKSTQQQLIDERASKGLNQTFRAPSDPKPSLLRLPISMPMLLGAIGFLLAAIVLIFLPDMSKRVDAKKTEVVESVPVLQPVLVPTEVVGVASTPVAPAATASQSQATPPALSPPAVTASMPTTVAKPIAPVPSPVASAPTAAVSGAPTLRMVAKGVVWVEVKDAKGTVLAQRTLQPKEVLNVTGAAPLAVVVGRINEMQSVDVRGKPFSLAGLSPDNVARFEIK